MSAKPCNRPMQHHGNESAGSRGTQNVLICHFWFLGKALSEIMGFILSAHTLLFYQIYHISFYSIFISLLFFSSQQRRTHEIITYIIILHHRRMVFIDMLVLLYIL